MHTKFCLESLEGIDHSVNAGVDGDNIKLDLREIGLESFDWIHMAQDWDSWWAFVNTSMNLLFT
jgi:hypothetical protein